eukprot:6411583-Alexandrium_andersonii.AAC.1
MARAYRHQDHWHSAWAGIRGRVVLGASGSPGGGAPRAPPEVDAGPVQSGRAWPCSPRHRTVALQCV